jgi:ArsR family transcriptional regulator
MNRYSHVVSRNQVRNNASASSDSCEIEFVDEAAIKSVRKGMKSDRTMLHLADIFSVISDPTRIKLVFALAKAELCVCDLAVLLGITRSGISHQLRVLRSHRLVKYRKAGKLAYYSLDNEHIEGLLKEGLRHVEAR